jgi:hypothetical protein
MVFQLWHTLTSTTPRYYTQGCLDISQERPFRISKKIFFITTRGTLKDGQTQFCGLFFWTHIVSQVAVRAVVSNLNVLYRAGESSICVPIKQD